MIGTLYIATIRILIIILIILDKFSEDAMARHSRNMKNKITTPRGKGKMAPSPSRGNNTARPSTMSMSGKNISNVNNGSTMNGMGSTNKNFGSTNQKSTKPVLRMKEIKNKIIDHQRLLEDQILEDRRRKDSARQKEEDDELSFMKAMKGNNYGNNSSNNNNYNNNNDDQFQSDFSINTDRNFNNNNNYNNGYGSKKSSPNKFGSKFDNTENNGSFSSRFGGSDFNNDSPQSRAQTAAHQPKFNSLATVAAGSLNGGVPVGNGRDRSNNFQDKNNYGNLRY